MVEILLRQTLIMFVLAFVGFVMFKKGMITKEGSKSIGNILIFLSLPCVMINGFQVERTKETMIGLGISAAVAFVALVVSMIVSSVCFRNDGIAVFASSFSNPGFFGISLIVACISKSAVFYIASFIVFLNILQWSYGVYKLTKDKKMISVKNMVKSPAVIATAIGLFFFFTGITLPEIPSKVVSMIADINTPLAMFTIGIYMAEADFKKLFCTGKIYLVSLVRLIVIPLITMCVLSLVPNTYFDLKVAVLIAAACPVGSNVAVYAQRHQCDYTYAVETVVLSTAFSIATIPAIVKLATVLWQ